MSSLNADYDITLTKNAIKRIHSLVEKESNSNTALRVLVSGGGCSGFQYNFTMEELNSHKYSASDDDDDYDIEDDEDDDFDYDEEDDEDEGKFDASDIAINDEYGKPVLLIDSNSVNFLKSSIVDYIEDLNGSGFIIKNPLAKSSCGCGNSFAI